MSNVSELERLWKLETQVNKLILDGKRSPQKLLDTLQMMLEEKFRQLELYRHRAQLDGNSITGLYLDQHLHETGLYERTLSLEDPEIKGWLENPETYPEEYKGKAIFLWKSQRGFGDDRRVAYLVWHDGRVIVRWGGLEDWWGGFSLVLLASS